jgi:signal transduction histidine kinase
VQRGDEIAQPWAAEEIERFMAMAAHDVRNPVAVMRASAQMAQRSISRGDVEAAHQRLKAIVDQTARVTEILETFLDAARIGTGEFALRLEHVDLREIVEDGAERARMLAGDRAERGLECSLPDGCIGVWDRARLVRAVRALLTNALLYGDPARPVRVEADCTVDRVRITVSGGGSGPGTEEAAHLFERFYRGPSAAESGYSGSGLGLFTARGIARRHGGDVRFVEGDRFEMELPLTPHTNAPS